MRSSTKGLVFALGTTLVLAGANSSSTKPQKPQYTQENYLLKTNKGPIKKDKTLEIKIETDPTSVFFDKIKALGVLVYLEAANCPLWEQIAVAYTVPNRQDLYKKSMIEVMFAHSKYSCFNDINTSKPIVIRLNNYDKIIWKRCLRIAEGVLSGKYPNPGATHFYNSELVAKAPSWEDKLERIVMNQNGGKHRFFKES